MTNRYMVKPSLAAKADPASRGVVAPEPNRTPLPAMPGTEDSPTPKTHEEPMDSPQPNASAKREKPGPGEIGLSTQR